MAGGGLGVVECVDDSAQVGGRGTLLCQHALSPLRAVQRRQQLRTAVVRTSHVSQSLELSGICQECSGAGTQEDGVPHYFRQEGRVPHSSHFFGLKFVPKLVHCCNWLLTETQCKIISVQQN